VVPDELPPLLAIHTLPAPCLPRDYPISLAPAG